MTVPSNKICGLVGMTQIQSCITQYINMVSFIWLGNNTIICLFRQCKSSLFPKIQETSITSNPYEIESPHRKMKCRAALKTKIRLAKTKVKPFPALWVDRFVSKPMTQLDISNRRAFNECQGFPAPLIRNKPGHNLL